MGVPVTGILVVFAPLCRIIEIAADEGFVGFGGQCGIAAIAIRRVLFPEGKVVGAVNRALFEEAGRMIGHFAVEFEGQYWDADGEAKDWEEIESWGVFDPSDSDYADIALDAMIAWDDYAAGTASRIEPSDEKIIKAFGKDAERFLSEFTLILSDAKAVVMPNDPGNKAT
jgi:hypothetical protein